MQLESNTYACQQHESVYSFDLLAVLLGLNKKLIALWNPLQLNLFLTHNRVWRRSNPLEFLAVKTPSPAPVQRRFSFGENVDDPNTFSNVPSIHPTLIIESAWLVSVDLPIASHTLDLPEGIGLSLLQKEKIKSACHQLPKTLIKVTAPHPAEIVESASLASVATPVPSFNLNCKLKIGLSQL